MQLAWSTARVAAAIQAIIHRQPSFASYKRGNSVWPPECAGPRPTEVTWANCWAQSAPPEGCEAIELAIQDPAIWVDILGKQPQKVPCFCPADSAAGHGAGGAGPAAGCAGPGSSGRGATSHCRRPAASVHAGSSHAATRHGWDADGDARHASHAAAACRTGSLTGWCPTWYLISLKRNKRRVLSGLLVLLVNHEPPPRAQLRSKTALGAMSSCSCGTRLLTCGAALRSAAALLALAGVPMRDFN